MGPSKGRAIDDVVVAIDFSAAAEAGMAWGAAVARRHGATLHLAHAVPPMPIVGHPATMAPEELDDLARGAGERLDELAARWRSEGPAVERHVLVGEPGDVIEEVAQQVAAGLVVLTTRGLGGLRSMLLGSTTRRVIRRCPCPVLTVPPEVSAPRLPLRRILLPTDVEAPLAEVAGRAISLLGDEASRLLVLHAWHLPAEYTIYGEAGARRLGEARSDAKAWLAEAMQRTLAPLEQLGVEASGEGVEGRVVSSIVDQAADREVDLIAMPTQRRSRLQQLVDRSVTERVVRLASCPVLSLCQSAPAG